MDWIIKLLPLITGVLGVLLGVGIMALVANWDPGLEELPIQLTPWQAQALGYLGRNMQADGDLYINVGDGEEGHGLYVWWEADGPGRAQRIHEQQGDDERWDDLLDDEPPAKAQLLAPAPLHVPRPGTVEALQRAGLL